MMLMRAGASVACNGFARRRQAGRRQAGGRMQKAGGVAPTTPPF